jgi:hypothetical protein
VAEFEVQFADTASRKVSNLYEPAGKVVFEAGFSGPEIVPDAPPAAPPVELLELTSVLCYS